MKRYSDIKNGYSYIYVCVRMHMYIYISKNRPEYRQDPFEEKGCASNRMDKVEQCEPIPFRIEHVSKSEKDIIRRGVLPTDIPILGVDDLLRVKEHRRCFFQKKLLKYCQISS